jgi:outer membrane protein assembly factor BamB
MKYLSILALLALPLLVAVPPAPAQEKANPNDWPLFRGNALQTGVTAAKLPDQLEVLWKFETKDGIDAAAAIVGDTVYVGSLDEHLYALDLKTGQMKWKYKATGGIKAPPSVDGGLVFVGDEDGMFHCLDATTGTKKWTFETGSEITSGANFAGKNILFGSHDSTLYCLDRDGKLVWKFKTQGPVNGSPLVLGNTTFVAGCDSALHVLDVRTGKELASIELSGQAAATAAGAGDKLYVPNMGNQVEAIDLKKNAVLWSYEAEKRSQPFYSSAALTDKLVIVGGRDKLVHALSRDKGTPVWTFPTKGRIDCSPVVAGGRVYVGSLDGWFYVLDAAKGTQVQKMELGRGITGSPAVGGGCLIIGNTEGTVYCLGAKK